MKRILGKPLALGRTAEIHAWEQGWILKLFFDWRDPEDIAFEQRMARAIHASGLPVPQAGEILEVNGRKGLLYERVDGMPMLERARREPWRLLQFARQAAELHAGMHANPCRPDLPDGQRRLENKIKAAHSLGGPQREAALAALAGMEEGSAICHGDFHPGNLLMTPTRIVVIDWIDASLGNPLADVARSSIILLGAAEAQVPNPALKTALRLFHAVYLQHYFRLRPGGKCEYRRWLPLVAAGRLSENIPELEGWLLRQAQVPGTGQGP